MSRYSESLKCSVAERYLRGEDSYARVGAPHCIDAATVRKWVASYRVHGLAGLSRKFGHYDGKFKLSVLRRMWEDGLSYRQTAALFNIRTPAAFRVGRGATRPVDRGPGAAPQRKAAIDARTTGAARVARCAE